MSTIFQPSQITWSDGFHVFSNNCIAVSPQLHGASPKNGQRPKHVSHLWSIWIQTPVITSKAFPKENNTCQDHILQDIKTDSIDMMAIKGWEEEKVFWVGISWVFDSVLSTLLHQANHLHCHSKHPHLHSASQSSEALTSFYQKLTEVRPLGSLVIDELMIPNGISYS